MTTPEILVISLLIFILAIVVATYFMSQDRKDSPVRVFVDNDVEAAIARQAGFEPIFSRKRLEDPNDTW